MNRGLSFLDGNAAAGELQNVFSVDVTSAIGQCATCGRVAPLADTRVYAFEPGIVIRCTGCESGLARLVKGAGCTWLDLRGLIFLRIETPAQS
jgi:hypothetical protein